MKTNIKIALIGLALIGFCFLLSCEKGFDSINKDPNAIVEVPSDYLLPGAIFTIVSKENSYMENLNYASAWTQQISCAYWATNGSYFYEKARGYLWNDLYAGPLKDLKTMYEFASEDNNQTQKAVALIMSSYAYILLTDCYGPIPYTQALKAEKSASAMLKNKEKIVIKDEYDILFNGDAKKWFKFSNSLRLRIMMRISFKKNMSSEIQSLVNDPELPLLESNSDNATFTFPGTSTKNYNPFYSTLSSESTDGGYRLCNTLVDYMLETSDPRLNLYGLLNEGGSYNGLPSGQGISSNNIESYSKVNPIWGLKNRPTNLLTYSEVQFLMAEACQRGIITGTSSLYYYQAIKAHFDELGLSLLQYNTFIARPKVAYNNTLSLIMKQKWVSLFTRGIEAWTEQRRTGYPELIPVVGGAVNVIPYRFLYPISEEQSNKTNLQDAISTLNNGDALDSKIWWINQ